MECKARDPYYGRDYYDRYALCAYADFAAEHRSRARVSLQAVERWRDAARRWNYQGWERRFDDLATEIRRDRRISTPGGASEYRIQVIGAQRLGFWRIRAHNVDSAIARWYEHHGARARRYMKEVMKLRRGDLYTVEATGGRLRTPRRQRFEVM